MARGGYVLADAPGGKPEVILIGTGSEVSLCVEAYEKLMAEGIKARRGEPAVLGAFDAQPAEYRDVGLAAGRNAAGGRRSWASSTAGKTTSAAAAVSSA